MNNLFSRAMSKAKHLTTSGKLHAATALIQSVLAKGQGSPAAAGADDAIDGKFTRLADAPPAAAPSGAARRAHKASGSPRSPLAEMLRKIAAGGMPRKAPQPAGPVEIPEGARFLALTHTSARGSRDYRLYLPANHPDGRLPLVVMLHGCTQTPEDFAIGTGMNALAEEFGCLVAWPAQPAGANVQKCWNWFRPQDQARHLGEPALIAGLTRDILRDHSADPARVYVAGLSAGGAAAAIVAMAYPEIFSAVGVHSGLAVGGAWDVPSAFAAMRSAAPGKIGLPTVPTICFHGTADATVHAGNGTAVLDQALQCRPGLRIAVEQGTAPGGRRFRRTHHRGDDGRTEAELWEVDGAGHAWAGGQAGGSYTDPAGPDASREMLRFFRQHARI